MKISEVLINSHKTRKQMTGNLALFVNGQPAEYCALGTLACEKNMIKEPNDVEQISYPTILRMYGINPNIDVEMPKGHNSLAGLTYSLATAIWKLNDSYEWNFKKIGKWIEKLEKKGVIVYED